MQKSESIANLAAALSRVQGKLHGAVKDSVNPFFKSTYANLESVWESIRAPMLEEGLSVSQMPGVLPTGQPALITMLMHKSGEFLSSEQPLFLAKQDPQGMAAAITYARRSALSAIIGQVEVEDDGETAMGRGEGAKPGADASPKVTENQLKRLFAIQNKHGVTEEQVKSHIGRLGLTSRKDLNREQYDALIAKIEAKK